LTELVVARSARDAYQLDATVSSRRADVPAVLQTLRALAHRMNLVRSATLPSDAPPVVAGHLHAIGLINRMMHAVIRQYAAQRNPGAMERALAVLNAELGQPAVEATLGAFLGLFPPASVYRGELSPGEYLRGSTAGVPNRLVVLADLLVLWLSNQNPAFAPYEDLFVDEPLAARTAYEHIMGALVHHFRSQPGFGPEDQGLADMLRSPAIAVPASIPGQVEYIRDHWGYLLGDQIPDLLRALDVMSEEAKAALPGPGPIQVADFSDLDAEWERFSPDRDWMPSLVLIAKNTYVWLDQLSKWHGRPVTRLDQIPDSELDVLAQRGFTGLWLIGLWERSEASRRIKQMCGNPDAVASAYSLKDYAIASDLGGSEAFRDLQARAWERGIRLSADMVPNHVGIDSRWVVEHPGWFISLDQSPFPAYSFNGPDLSRDERVGIYLEDHYYDRSDAAVVFKRVDHWTGEERYIYHGNDGTSMPWNDTAQLDYLLPEVREAVIQTILHVARTFPVIRFDAAMTLTRRHFQRLWYPEPGAGGDIPSRAEHGLTKADFSSRMPHEFWREVVDRVAEEAPDTLLLAEAFWLLEGYFVRTLGMHRVYNSAFMHMLRDEDNAKYRSVIKNTLEFDPRILGRYVNFMNNPDEETAVNQFGKGDKYFGICTLLATLPGLPMIGHGQIEGLSEKYGMEYRRAYREEVPDADLVRRHEREIVPLLRRRPLFAGSDEFLLYDFFTPQGLVNEDVLAYSNCMGSEHALIIYHNRYADTRGYIRTSAAYAPQGGAAGQDEEVRAGLRQRSLAEGLGLIDDDRAYTILRDQVSGLEYIRSNKRLFTEGLLVRLGAYQRHVFLDIRQVFDDARHPYARLEAKLDGAGVPSIGGALRNAALEPVLAQYRSLANAITWRSLARCAQDQSARAGPDARSECSALVRQIEDSSISVLREIRRFLGASAVATEAWAPEAIAYEMRQDLETVLGSSIVWPGMPQPARPLTSRLAPEIITETLDGGPASVGTLFGWLFLRHLGKLIDASDDGRISTEWLDQLRLGSTIRQALHDLGLDDEATSNALLTVRVLTRHQEWLSLASGARGDAARVLDSLLGDEDVRKLIHVNRHRGVLWLNKEAYEEMLRRLLIPAALNALAAWHREGHCPDELVARARGVVGVLRSAAVEAGYRLERLRETVKTKA
jgi:glycosidase